MDEQDGAATARRYDLELRAVKEGLEVEKRQLEAELQQAKAQVQALLVREQDGSGSAQSALISQLQAGNLSMYI